MATPLENSSHKKQSCQMPGISISKPVKVTRFSWNTWFLSTWFMVYVFFVGGCVLCCTDDRSGSGGREKQFGGAKCQEQQNAQRHWGALHLFGWGRALEIFEVFAMAGGLRVGTVKVPHWDEMDFETHRFDWYMLTHGDFWGAPLYERSTINFYS